MLNMNLLKESCRTVRDRLPADIAPECALVLGSGWGGVVEGLKVVAEVDYAEIPCLGATRVEGHDGRLVIVDWAGIQVAAFQGRRHWYEGQGWDPVVFPVLLSRHLGAETLLLTNAAGGIRADLSVGSLMVIDDHINAMGSNPLIGPHHPEWGSFFPDQSEVYDRRLRELMDRARAGADITLSHGIYIGTSGPAYETPAEIAAFRTMGADAVGMSTVPEAIVASASGMSVAGISCITNNAAGASNERLSHREVVDVAREAGKDMRALLSEFFKLRGAE